MLQTFQIAALLSLALAMSFAVAHAAEMPGKMRLDRAAYMAVQGIYYPGFTIGGISEPVAIVVLAVLVLVTPAESAAFVWTAGAFAAPLAMQAIYWIRIHPINKFWLKDRNLSGAGTKFFKTASGGTKDDAWTALRNRWEQAHVVRALLAFIGVAMLAVAVTRA